MKETFWTYLFIVLGLLTIAIMILVQNLTSTSEENYYLTKEVMEAAMIDSIDYGLYRKTGEIRMIESKFVENFTRRFAESINDSKEYTLDFYEIYENPPKATVVVKTETGSQTITSDSTVNFDIRTVMSGILETKYSESDSVLAVDLTTDRGTVLGKTKYTSYEGRVIFEVNAPVPYVVEGSTITCSDNGVDIETNDNQIIISNVRRNTSCYAKLNEGRSVTLTMNSGTGQVVGDKIKAVIPGERVSFEVQAADGYTLEDPTITCSGGAAGSRSGNKIVISGVNTSQVCDVTLKRGKYKVTFNVINGSTTISNPLEIEYGETKQIPITPDSIHSVKDMKVTCSRGATTSINKNIINLSNVYASQVCTVELISLDLLNSYYIITADNQMRHYNKSGELLKSETLNGTFTPYYEGEYTIVLYGGGGGGGGGAYREDGCYIACCINNYREKIADGGNGGSSASEFLNVYLERTPYRYSVGAGGTGGYHSYVGNYWNTAYGGSGTSGTKTMLGSYSVDGGEGGYGGTANSYYGNAYNGSNGLVTGNLRNYNRYFGIYQKDTKYDDKYGIGNYGKPGTGGRGSSYEDGTDGTAGVILIIYTDED